MTTVNKQMDKLNKWQDINWKVVERQVWKQQTRIFKASRCGDVKKVHKLQRLLINSFYAKLIAVRRVSQDNQGKKTAGVDGVKSLSPEARLKLVENLSLHGKSKPTRRVWIPKPNGEKRPLGIPTIEDRALQALVKLALEPEWEAKFEPNSYGFRIGRNCHDAIEAIFLSIKQKPKYVLDADIAKCFDQINHEKLLDKLGTFATMKKQIKSWLNSGVFEGKDLFPTDKGTPQGGVISPLLANIALHGMEEKVKEYAENIDMKNCNGSQISKQAKKNSLTFIRYADDFVVMHESKEVIEQCKAMLEKWLNEIDLELKPSKTRITHTLNPNGEEKQGFNFLGFTIRQYKAGKCKSGLNSRGEKLGFKTEIKPSKESVQKHYKKIAETIDKHRGVSQIGLIRHLNPIIRGWCNYFKPYQSSKAFSKLKTLVQWKLWKWCKRRHPNKGSKWIKNKYWHTKNKDRWNFSTREGHNQFELVKHTSISTNIGYTKVKGNSTPYEGNLMYWSSRLGKHPEMPMTLTKLLKDQKGKCNWCGLIFKDEDIVEKDHITPKSKGGTSDYKNLQLLHRHCHDKKTTRDGSLGTKSDCNSIEPKPPLISNIKWIEDMMVMM